MNELSEKSPFEMELCAEPWPYQVDLRWNFELNYNLIMEQTFRDP